jgi:hypothetical protein
MALVTTNAGELMLLDYMLKQTSISDTPTSGGYIINLFNNNVTPSQSSVTGDFVDATFSSYASYTLSRSGWASPTTSVFGAGVTKAVCSYSQQSWTCGVTGDTIYGYYITSGDGATLLWAEKFASSRVLADTDQLIVRPVFTLNSEN